MQRWYEVTLRRRAALQPGHAGVAILMLVGTVYLFITMPTGFIPSQDSGFMFAGTLAPQDISFDSVAAPQSRGRRNPARASGRQERRRLRGRAAIRAFMFANMKPREQRELLGGPDHRAAAPQDGRRSPA